LIKLLCSKISLSFILSTLLLLFYIIIIIIIIIITYILDSSTLAGSAASAAELNKIAKYTDIIAGVDFVPFVIETSGLSRK